MASERLRLPQRLHRTEFCNSLPWPGPLLLLLPQRLHRTELCNRACLQSCRKPLKKRSRALDPATFRDACDLFFDLFSALQAAFFQIPTQALSNAIALSGLGTFRQPIAEDIP